MSVLAGKVALITGSTRGIGWSSAERLAEAGATVVINGRDQKLLAGRLEALQARYPGAHTAEAFDVGDAKAVSAAYQRLFAQYGRLDVLVNNAGILGDALIGMIGSSLIEDVISTNLKGVINNLQSATKLMKRQRAGSIINLTSIVGRRGNAGQVLYSASKSGVIGITMSAAKELGPDGIRVNAIAPGYIATDMTRHLDEARRANLLRGIAMGRAGSAADVANAVLFLASDQSAYVSGQILGVDGCMSL